MNENRYLDIELDVPVNVHQRDCWGMGRGPGNREWHCCSKLVTQFDIYPFQDKKGFSGD